MRNKITIYFIIIAHIFYIKGYCSEPQALLDSAGNFYEKQQYAEAVESYQRCLNKYGSSASLYANMANAYTKLGDYGNAFLCYERCLKLDPSNKEARNNRSYILGKINDANKANVGGKKISVLPDEKGFFSKLGTFLTHSHTSNTWAVCGVIMFILFCVCAGLYYFREEVIVRKIGFFAGLTFLGLCIVFNILAITSANAIDKANEGVLMEFKTSLKAEPFANSKTVGVPLVRGTKMEVLEIQNTKNGKPAWYKVRLNSDIAGWIEAQSFELI
ncbi:MAG: tetratricopeptide repeat protein [Roseburia sp.]|nr:tetratricopeptide repeat protein [Roseburia sp.]